MINVSTVSSSAMYDMNTYFIELRFHFTGMEFIKM